MPFLHPWECDASLPGYFPGVSGNSFSPDFCVGVPVVIVRVIDILLAAVLIDVLRRNEMHRRDIARWLLSREGTIELVDHLPTLEDQRLRHRRRLKLTGPDPLIGRDAPVARADIDGRPGRVTARVGEGRPHEIVIEV